MSQKELELEIDILKKQMTKQQKKIDQYGLLRLFILFVGMLLLLGGIIDQHLILVFLSALPIIFFLVIAFSQNQAKEKLANLKAHLGIDEALLLRKTNDWMSGQISSMAENMPAYLEDLDVFGKDSLYNYLCFCRCEASQKALAYYLKMPLKDAQKIKEMQAVFAELSKHPLSLQLLIEESLLSNQERKSLQQSDFDHIPSMPMYLKIFTFFYPICFILSLVLMKFNPGIGAMMVLLSLIVSGLHFDLWQQASNKATRQLSASKTLDKLAKEVMSASFQEPFLQKKQQEIRNFYLHRKKLGWIDQLFKMRANPLLLVILDGLFFYDGFLYLWFSKQPPATYLLTLQDLLGEMGAFCSLSFWFVIKEKTVFPEISDHLLGSDLRHPLMVHDEAVGATFDFKEGPVVITGSNMAGKTTFMRNLGLNMVLLSRGLSVDASYFGAPLMDIYTSMRVADRTQEGVSTFYGELLRIKEMIACAKNSQPALFLIDEIFKGTNLKDRIIGAKAVIKQLSYPGAFLFVSTHDEQLCYHDEVNITNIHFSEYYQDGKIYFDYLLKMGICQTTNAYYLMKMIGLLE